MTSSPPGGLSSIPAVVLIAAVVLGAGSHLVAAFGASGPMSWAMVAMGVACLSCLLHLRGPLVSHTMLRAAGHLMAMTVAMIAIHLLWLVSMGAGSGGHSHGAMPHSSTATAFNSHTIVMMGLIGVELICLALGAAVLRHARNPQPRAVPATAAQSV